MGGVSVPSRGTPLFAEPAGLSHLHVFFLDHLDNGPLGGEDRDSFNQRSLLTRGQPVVLGPERGKQLWAHRGVEEWLARGTEAGEAGGLLWDFLGHLGEVPWGEAGLLAPQLVSP